MLEMNSTLSVLDCEAARWPPFLSSAHLDHTPSSYLFAFTSLWLATRTISLINQYCTYLHRPILQDHVPVTLVIKGKMGNDSFFISTEMLRAYNEGGISRKTRASIRTAQILLPVCHCVFKIWIFCIRSKSDRPMGLTMNLSSEIWRLTRALELLKINWTLIF
jgi:hypothetical protein